MAMCSPLTLEDLKTLIYCFTLQVGDRRLFQKDGAHVHPGIKHALAERKFSFYVAILSANCFPAP